MKRTTFRGAVLFLCLILLFCAIPASQARAAGETTADAYIKNNCSVFNAYGSTTANGAVNVMSFPCDATANSNSKKVVTLSSGGAVTILRGVNNTAKSQTWYEVKATVSSKSYQGYVLAGGLNLTNVGSSAFVSAKCVSYPTSCTITAKAGADIYTMPTTSTAVNAFTKKVATLAEGISVTPQAVITNPSGEAWYQISVGGDIKTGYIYGGKVTTSLNAAKKLSISGIQAPSGQRKAEPLTLKGTITSSDLWIVRVETRVMNSSTGAIVTGGSDVGLTTKSYSIQGKSPDTGCVLKNANDKTVLYLYTITATVRNYYTTDGTSLTHKDEAQQLYQSEFWVGTTKPTTTYNVYYDANGGSGAPADQIKTSGKTLTLSAQKPVRAGYDFVGWATSKTALTPTYQAGGSYTRDADITLYALWKVSTPVIKGWNKEDGKWYYYGDQGDPVTGLQTISGKTYYFDKNGVMQTGWQKSGSKWYYCGADGAALTGWQKMNAKWYYFNTDGSMRTGWLQDGSKWYYFNTDGVMQTGWQKINNKWYFLNTDGAMLTGWQKLNAKWYYLGGDGVMKTGWQKISDNWYFFNADGVMQTGWLQDGGQWYWLDASGKMLKGWQEIGGRWYHFNKSGVMETGWLQDGGNWYWFDANGRMAANTSITIDGKSYTFDASGKMV